MMITDAKAKDLNLNINNVWGLPEDLDQATAEIPAKQ